MFEKFFGKKETPMTNEQMLADTLKTPKGSYFNNLTRIVAAMVLAGFVLPLVPIDKAVAAGPTRIATQSVAGGPKETKQMTEKINPQTETGQKKMAELLQNIKDEKGIEVTMAGNFLGQQEQAAQIESAEVNKSYQDAYQNAKKNRLAYQEVSLKTGGQSVKLNNFLSALGIGITPEVYNILDQTDYRAVFCYRDANNIDKGFKLNIAQPTYEQSYYERIYADGTLEKMLDGKFIEWETTIMNDFKDVFFAGSELSKTGPIFQNAEYDKIPFRYATVKDQKGNDVPIAYSVFEGSFFVANNLDCLKSMLHAAKPEGGQ
jgi:hypothetical protein